MDKVGYIDLLIVLFVAINGFAIFFYFSPFGGNVRIESEESYISYWDALYYTAVTFSSLGYGDYLPVGFNRFASALCVFSGLTYFAIAVGKIASERTQATLTLVHRSDVNRNLREFSGEIDRLRRAIDDFADKERRLRLSNLRQLEFNLHETEILHSKFRRYVIFHINQSTSIIHGNDASMSGVMKAYVNLLKALRDAHFLANDRLDAGLSKKSLSLIASIIKFLSIVETHKEINDPSDTYIHNIYRSVLNFSLSALHRFVQKFEKIMKAVLKRTGARQAQKKVSLTFSKLKARLQVQSRVPKSWRISLQESKVLLNEIEQWRSKNILAEIYQEVRHFMGQKPRTSWAISDRRALAQHLNISQTKVKQYLNELVLRGDA